MLDPDQIWVLATAALAMAVCAGLGSNVVVAARRAGAPAPRMALTMLRSPASLSRAASILFSFAAALVIFAVIYRHLPRVRLRSPDLVRVSTLTAALYVLGRRTIVSWFTRQTLSARHGPVASLGMYLVWIAYMAVVVVGVELALAYAQRYRPVRLRDSIRHSLHLPRYMRSPALATPAPVPETP
jgi:membrane protein